MEIGVRVETEHPLTGERTHCCTSYLTFVSINSEGSPIAVPKLDSSGNEEWQRRAYEANIRRDLRLKMRAIRKEGGVFGSQSR